MEGISFEISDEEYTEEEPQDDRSTEGYPDPITPHAPDAPPTPEVDEDEQSEPL